MILETVQLRMIKCKGRLAIILEKHVSGLRQEVLPYSSSGSYLCLID